MSRRSTGDALAAALETTLSRYMGDMRDVRHDWTDWHSATFVGARHEMRFVTTVEAAAKLATMAEDELPLSRGFVADVVVVAQSPGEDGVIVVLELLTIGD
jgi:hypothetical protein